jgi:HEXXH motif-containing protein
LTLQEHIEHYIEHPFPLWNNELTKLLVLNKWNELSSSNLVNDPYKYSITNSITKEHINNEFTIPLHESNIKVAVASVALQSFYEKHGLKTTDIKNNQQIIVSKIERALEIIKSVPEVFSFVDKIVKSVQIIDAEYADTDTSYSHPEIPFSIFFSVCEEESSISDLRVAESVLHEAMHLKLTLIERHIDLIEPNSKDVFYSPWRNEERPLRGILHGLFVFKAVLDFYTILKQKSISKDVNEYIAHRISEIKREINFITTFSQSEGLTAEGQKLSSMLLE